MLLTLRMHLVIPITRKISDIASGNVKFGSIFKAYLRNLFPGIYHLLQHLDCQKDVLALKPR